MELVGYDYTSMETLVHGEREMGTRLTQYTVCVQ